MKLGILIYSNDAETVWNAFRLANFALTQGDEAQIFLLSKGVECLQLDTEKFKVTEQAGIFVSNGGRIMACGSCLKLRGSSGSTMCSASSMKDLYQMIRECEKILTF